MHMTKKMKPRKGFGHSFEFEALSTLIKEATRLDKLIRIVSSVIGAEQDFLVSVM